MRNYFKLQHTVLSLKYMFRMTYINLQFRMQIEPLLGVT